MKEIKLENVIIKPLEKDDYEDNLNLINSIIKESHFLARSKEINSEESKVFIRTYIDHPLTIYLCAFYERELIGHAYCLPRNEDLLEHIVIIGYAVKKNYRNFGICTLLLNKLILELQKKNRFIIMVAEVAEDNIASIKLLKKFNFKKLSILEKGMIKQDKSFIALLSFSRTVNQSQFQLNCK